MTTISTYRKSEMETEVPFFTIKMLQMWNQICGHVTPLPHANHGPLICHLTLLCLSLLASKTEMCNVESITRFRPTAPGEVSLFCFMFRFPLHPPPIPPGKILSVLQPISELITLGNIPSPYFGSCCSLACGSMALVTWLYNKAGRWNWKLAHLGRICCVPGTVQMIFTHFLS